MAKLTKEPGALADRTGLSWFNTKASWTRLTNATTLEIPEGKSVRLVHGGTLSQDDKEAIRENIHAARVAARGAARALSGGIENTDPDVLKLLGPAFDAAAIRELRNGTRPPHLERAFEQTLAELKTLETHLSSARVELKLAPNANGNTAGDGGRHPIDQDAARGGPSGNGKRRSRGGLVGKLYRYADQKINGAYDPLVTGRMTLTDARRHGPEGIMRALVPADTGRRPEAAEALVFALKYRNYVSDQRQRELRAVRPDRAPPTYDAAARATGFAGRHEDEGRDVAGGRPPDAGTRNRAVGGQANSSTPGRRLLEPRSRGGTGLGRA